MTGAFGPLLHSSEAEDMSSSGNLTYTVEIHLHPVYNLEILFYKTYCCSIFKGYFQQPALPQQFSYTELMIFKHLVFFLCFWISYVS